MSVNLLRSNRDYDAVLRQVEAVDPDVVLFQEYSAGFHDACARRLTGRYPHVEAHPADDCFGVAIWSRQPFVQEDDALLFLGDHEIPAIRVEVEIDGRRTALYNVHLLPPLRAYFRDHLRENEELRERLRRETSPTIVAGDFNMTNATRAAGRLRRLGFRDAHVLAGRGRGVTWPALGMLSYAPGIRIDHVYVGPGLDARECRVGAPCGSDHLPIIAVVGLTEP
jgi:endonuclease/exonuclease/phosphatase (EEP) superfamily protein YafD